MLTLTLTKSRNPVSTHKRAPAAMIAERMGIPTYAEIKSDGYARGWSIASWQDMPEIGTIVRTFDLPDFSGPIETVYDAEEVFMSMANESESNSRQYSPFEDACSDLNRYEEFAPFDVWQAYEDGIADGISANWTSRKSYYED